MKIYFTRHGETEWNRKDIIQGWKDSPLTEEGIAMARELAVKAKNIPFDHVYSSDLKRAYHTAKIICPHRRIIRTRLLREIDVGYWSGKHFKDVQHRDPALHRRYFENPKRYNRLDGESFYDLIKRVETFFQKAVYSSEDQNILVVSHGITMIAMFFIMEKLPMEQFWDNRVRRNAEFNVAEYKDGQFTILKKAPLNPITTI
ncbi:MAG: histidine phosphatase family protein [Tissierellia bacterium]|nr:histidine phosphatase family protein [Tissierellia bacterium]